jgi:hypothetical protein
MTALGALAIVAAQFAFLRPIVLRTLVEPLVPAHMRQRVSADDQEVKLHAQHSPVLGIAGFVTMLSGIFIRRGSTWARRAAQCMVIFGWVWSLVFGWQQESLNAKHDETSIAELTIVFGIVGSLFALCAAVLLVTLSRPQRPAIEHR